MHDVQESKADQGASQDAVPASIGRRIFDLYDQLTASEKKLAKVVLECQDNLAAYSATELADRAGVSKATAVRFVRRLGYASYNAARIQMCVLAIARTMGARRILATDPTATGGAGLAGCVLRCYTCGVSLFDSYVAPMGALNHLCTGLMVRRGDRAVDRFDPIERLHGALATVAQQDDGAS